MGDAGISADVSGDRLAQRVASRSVTPACPHLVHVFPTFAPGGVQIRISTIINHFAGAHRHTIVALDGEMGCASRLDPQAGAKVVSYRERPGSLLRRISQIREELAALGPDLLLTYNWGAVEWALANSAKPFAPHVHLESGFGPDEADRQIRRRVLFRRLALRNTPVLVVPSRTLVDIATRIWRFPAGRIRHIPNGVDLERFAAPADAAGLNGFVPAAGEIVVGTLAPLRPEKRLQRLIRVMADLSRRHALRLLVLGGGAERDMLESLAVELGIRDRVHFAGHVTAPETVLGLMDVFCITSETEQMPNSLVQAMAAGLPVVGLDVGDVRHVLAPANRKFVAPKSDMATFANLLERLIEDPGLRSSLGRGNRRHVGDHYTQDRMFAAYGDLFDEVIRPAVAVGGG